MTQEQKDLLLKDLCARLPYRVKVYTPSKSICTIFSKPTIDSTIVIDGAGEEVCNISDIKPYLFPLSSMTMEQEREWQSLMVCDIYGIFYHTIESFDYLYKNHIDIRGLIPMGLAIDASGKNIY